MSDTLTPLELTMQVRDISVTERNSFKQCRRRWFLETVDNLEPRGVIAWSLEFGTGIHSGLEAYYRTVAGMDGYTEGTPLEYALTAFGKWVEYMDDKIVNAGLGDLASGLRNEVLEYETLGVGMLKNYHKYASVEDDFVVCAVEGQWTEQGKVLLKKHGMEVPYGDDVHPVLHESGRLLVPMVDPESKKSLAGEPMLSMRLDLVIYVKTRGLQGFWVMDHKTSASAPSDRGIDMDDQVTGYSYGFWRYTGIVPRGTIFDYLIKQLPKPPRLIREGEDLSSAKDQLTTAEWYKEALIEFGYYKNGRVTSEKHAQCYAGLLALKWIRFFDRKRVQRNEHELQMFEMRLVEEYADMVEVRDNPERKAYPHLSQYNCPGCPMMRICQAIEDGSDYESIIDSAYQQAEDRKA